MKNIRCLLSLVWLWAAFACVRYEEIHFEDVPRKLVVNAIASPEGLRAHVSKSALVTDNQTDFELPSAQVSVFVNKYYQGDMVLDDDPADSVNFRGQFILPGYTPQADEEIIIEASSDGFRTARGETRFPVPCRIERVDTTRLRPTTSPTAPDDSYRLRFHVRIADVPTDTTLCYRLFLNQVVTIERDGERWVYNTLASSAWESLYGLYYNYNPLGEYGGSTSIFAGIELRYEDSAFKSYGESGGLEQLDASYGLGTFVSDGVGEDQTIYFSVNPMMTSYRDDSTTVQVDYVVYLLSISEEYYNYFQSLRDYSFKLAGVEFGSLLESAASYGNVTDGLGLVASYQMDSVVIHMPFDTIPPRFP